MARTRFHDFRQEDSTQLFNDRLRAILPHGVYAGFNVVAGTSGGFYLDFEHDPDPDRTGQVLGSIVTPDGVQIQENADQQDVVLGSVSAGTPNVHYVVASYTYNKALPNNDVVYTVLQGTPGAPPTPPPLTDDQILLAVIDVPSGATAYTSTGVRIKTVGHKSILDVPSSTLFKSFEGILDPGIYEGLDMVVGSGALKVTLNPGTWVTKESIKVVETSALSDLFTITAPSAGNYKFCWAIGAHKHEDMTPYPDPDYLLVQGADAAVGTQATLPSDGTIVTAMGAISSKYDNIAYGNKLGIIRIENRAGTYYIDYIRGESYDRQGIIVYGANSKSQNRSGKYYGYQGLLQAISDIYAVSQALDRQPSNPFRLWLDGDFKTDDTVLHIPSNTALRGYGASAKLLSEINDPVSIVGFGPAWDSVNPTVTTSAGSSTPPTGYVSRVFNVQATYQIGFTLQQLRFSKYDRVEMKSDSNNSYTDGYYVSTLSAWSFEAWVPTLYQTDGYPDDLDIAIVKQNIELVDVEVGGINSGAGILAIAFAEKIRLDRVKTNRLYVAAVRHCNWGRVEVENQISLWSGYGNQCWDGRYNTVGTLYLRDTASTATLQFGGGSWFDKIDRIIYDNPNNTVQLRPEFGSFSCGRVDMRAGGGSTSVLGLYISDQSYQHLQCSGKVRTGNGHRIFVANTVCAELELQANGTDILFVMVSSPLITNLCTSAKNRILFSDQNGLQNDAQNLFNPDEDRNLRLVSNANIWWDATSGWLEWDDDLKFDIPWQTGYSVIGPMGAGLVNDGDRLYIDIDRDATGAVTATPNVRTKATATADRFQRNRVFVAIRSGSVVYLFDGTRIQDTQTVKVGSTPPPDNSVSWSAFTADALQFHRRFFRNFVDSEQTEVDFENSFQLQNAGTFSYTDGTGVIQYASTVDLSGVRPGDVVLLINVDYDPTSGTNRAFNREPIISVDDANDRITIAKGLGSFTIGSASRWNGAIARGNKVTYNNPSSPIGFTYAPAGANPGRVTFGGNFDFTQYQVRRGYVFVDSAGQKFPILSFDTSGNGAYVDIPPGLTYVNSSTPTSYDHGSIETNNNPYGTPLAEMRQVCGWEFVAAQNTGNRIKGLNDKLAVGAWPTSLGPWNAPAPMNSIPHDKRIVLRGNDNWPSVTQVPMAAGISPSEAYYAACTLADWAEFTGVCTGVVPVFSQGGSSTTTPHLDIYVDGEQIQNAISCTETDVDAVFGQAHAIYRVAGGGEGKSGRLRRLGYGVHHIRFEIPANGGFRGFIVINHLQDGTKTPKTWQTPGAALVNGKYRTYGAPSALDSVPLTPPSGWEKGSRHIRYIDRYGNYGWASTYITNFTTTGTVSSGSADINSVSDPSKWRIGDLVMFIYSGSKYLRRIINIVGTTITLNTTLSYSLSGAVMFYYGRSFNSQAGALSIKGPNYRENEDLAIKLPATEFVAPGPVANNRGTAADYAVTDSGGLRTSDLCTGFSCAANTGRKCGISLINVNQMVKIIFIGTGISMQAGTTTGVTIKLDGIDLGTWATATLSWETEGGQFVVGDLPYGVHVLEIDYVGNSFSIAGFSVFQPKRPTISSGAQPALELWESNALSASESVLGASTADGPDNYPVGCLTYDIRYAHPGGVNNTFREFKLGVPDLSLHNIEFDWLAGGGSNGFWVDMPFFGTDITLVYNTATLGGGAGTIVVEFLDHDGQFKAPGATTGFTSTGISAFTAASANCLRQKWTVSELGFHILRIRSTAASNYIDMEAVEVHTPFHMYKTQTPMMLDHLVPFANAGLDVRPRTPFRSVDVPSGNFVNVIGGEAHTSAAVLVQNMYPFVFYSFGGPVKITANYNFDDPALPGNWTALVLDGSQVIGYASADVPAAGGIARHSMSVVVYPAAGLHVAWITCFDPTTMEISNVTWTAEAYDAAPEGLRSRAVKLGASLGIAHIGDM